MKIGLVGWGVETQSAYRYYGPSHDYVIGNEEPREDFPNASNVTVYSLSEKRPPGLAGNVKDLSYLDHYGDCDMVIYQGATHKNLEKKFPENDPFWQKAKTPLHIFFEKVTTKNIVGVTGTKGKGTTSTLTAKLIEAGGKKCFLGGNIGLSPLDFMHDVKEDAWVVLELSSFQLYKFPYSPHIAVHLMMMPEHIDEWHLTMDDYVEAKRNIFLHQTEEDIAVYFPSNTFSSGNVAYSHGTHIPYAQAPGAYLADDGYITIEDTKLLHRSELKLIGGHNIQNICAAVTAAWNIHKDIDAYKKVLSTFSGLEHRLELVREFGGVRYYDDSFGTTPDTAIVALDAFTEKKVLVVGGHDKGNPFEALAKRLAADDLRKVIFIGTTGQKIAALARSFGLGDDKIIIRDDGNSWTMTEIVEAAKQSAVPGDIVLLSTGCASFGLFKDYKDRGNQFHQAVNQLS